MEKKDNRKNWRYLGFTKAQIYSVLPQLRKDNLSVLHSLSGFCGICFVILSIIPLAITKNWADFFSYLIVAAISLSYSLIALYTIKKENYKDNSFKGHFIYFFEIDTFILFILSFGLCSGVFRNSNHPAVMFFLFLICTESLFSCHLISNFLIIAISYAFFIPLAIHFKDQSVWSYDLSNCFFTLLLSCYIYYQTITSRIKRRLEEQRLTDANIALYDISNKDSLTKLYNRRKFYEEMQKLLIARDISKNTIAAMSIDIDNFGVYNDMYGHDNGDNALVSISDQFIKCAVRHDIVICRWGGEEFMAIVPVKTSEEAQAIAEEIRLAVESLHIVNRTMEGQKFLTVSIGLHVLSGNHTETWEEIYHNTYELLTHAKHEGKNRVEFSLN